MPLNYNLSKIDNYEELIEDQQMKQPYNTIVFATMIVGLGEITKKNYNKFYNRLNLIERVNGAFLWDSETKSPIYIQEGDIKRMIGLKVNVVNETKSKFISRLKTMFPTEL